MDEICVKILTIAGISEYLYPQPGRAQQLYGTKMRL